MKLEVVSGKCKEKGGKDTARMIRVTFQESLNFTRMKRSWKKLKEGRRDWKFQQD